MKSGIKSTEFYITLLPFLLLVVKEVSGIEFEAEPIVNGILGLSALVSSVLYIRGRILLKRADMEKKK